MEKIREHGSCFVCGKANPHSIGLEWYFDGNHIEGNFIFTMHHQGPPGFVHGGASAAVLDEAMGLAIWQAGYRVVTVNLMIDYRKPVPLGEPILIRGAMSGKAKRRIEASGEILLPDKSVAVFAKGIYVEDAHFLDQDVIPDFESKNGQNFF
jgi:acyl-coenzyme A thioesterase PaaI-like protein